jgi:hypothetical protein
MDIKDKFATSSKEHLRSLVRVHELDEVTSNGGKYRSATEEHRRGMKRKRLNFMRGEPPSWMRGLHRQNHASGGGKVHNHLRTHGSEGAIEPGRIGLGPVGPGRPAQPSSSVGSAPFPCSRRIFNSKTLEAPPFGRERAIRTRGPSTS